MENTKNLHPGVLKTIASYYVEPDKEKIALPRKTVTQKKTIQVEVDETVDKEVDVPNQAPGVVVIIIGIILLLLLVAELEAAGFFIGGIVIVIGVVLINTLKKTEIQPHTFSKTVPKVVEEEVLEPQQYEYRNKPNRYKVKKLGKINLHFSVVNIKDSKVMLFEEGETQQTFRFPVLKDAIQFSNSFHENEQILRKIPEILHGEKDHYDTVSDSEYGRKVPLRGYEKKLADYLLYVYDALMKKEMRHFKICLFNNKHVIQQLKPSFKHDEHVGANDINYVLQGDNGEILDNILQNWQHAISRNIDYVNDVRLHSLDGLLSAEFLKLGQTSKYSSFNFYCPQCNRALIDDLMSRDYSVQNTELLEKLYFSNNTRCHFIPDWDDNKVQWECPVCHERTTQPIPLHKALDESILPVYDKLMEEHKVIRDKKYSETKNKELDYRKEFKSRIDQVKYDNLSQVMALEDEMEKMKAEISGQIEAITYMNEIAQEYRNISSNLLTRIQDDTSEIEKRVQIRSEQLVESLQLYTERKLDEYSGKMDELSQAKRIDDERRETIMRNTVTALHQVRHSVEDNTRATVQTGEKIRSAVEDNTRATVESGERVKDAVDENTQTTKRGTDNIVKSNRQNREILEKNFALDVAVYKQQGYDVSNFTR